MCSLNCISVGFLLIIYQMLARSFQSLLVLNGSSLSKTYLLFSQMTSKQLEQIVKLWQQRLKIISFCFSKVYFGAFVLEPSQTRQNCLRLQDTLLCKAWFTLHRQTLTNGDTRVSVLTQLASVGIIFFQRFVRYLTMGNTLGVTNTGSANNTTSVS